MLWLFSLLGFVSGVGGGGLLFRKRTGERCPELTTIDVVDSRGKRSKRQIRCEQFDLPDGKPHHGPCEASDGLICTYYWELEE